MMMIFICDVIVLSKVELVKKRLNISGNCFTVELVGIR